VSAASIADFVADLQHGNAAQPPRLIQ